MDDTLKASLGELAHVRIEDLRSSGDPRGRGVSLASVLVTAR